MVFTNTKKIELLLKRYLKLKKNDDLLIISDEYHEVEIQSILFVAKKKSINSTKIIIPREHQKENKAKNIRIDKNILKKYEGIIIFTDHSPETTSFRYTCLNYFTEQCKRARAISMPGVNLKQYKFINDSFSKQNALGEKIAEILRRANSIDIETKSKKGKRYNLYIPIEKQNPVNNGGYISCGEWVNLPTGEVFILPQKNKTNGYIVINGAIPGFVISDNDEIILQLENGNIIGIESINKELKSRAIELFFKNGIIGNEKFPNSNTICEFGIGINKLIKDFSGIPQLDEKVFGTVHVAFGRNDSLGGDIIGDAHHDIVTKCNNLYVDILEKALIHQNRFSLPKTTQFINSHFLKLKFKENDNFKMEGSDCSFNRKEKTYNLTWLPPRGKPKITTIGVKNIKRELTILLDIIKSANRISYLEIQNKSNLKRINKNRLIYILKLLLSQKIIKIDS
ncbi:MAG: aminopeptidase [Ignavibacteria bacterium]|nr:aminopeptidase [Ignavibacteria bacterium]